ncbi:MAG TPA: hypothetical protein VGE16_09590 [Albitalea sp.]
MVLLYLTGLAALGLFAGIAWYLAPLKPNVIALQFAFTPKAFGEVVHFWSADLLLRFRAHLLVDYALLSSYGAFGYLLASRTRVFDSLPPALRHWATWALPLAAGFDAAENALHWWLTDVPRFGLHGVYLLAASCASMKWLVLLAYLCTLVLALARQER